MTLAVRCRNICKRYQHERVVQPVLDAFSMSLAAGQSLALVGRSGSGKSTLLSLIAGLDDPDSGEIDVGDVRVSAIGEPARTLFRRRNIGFVYQQFNLLPTLNVLDNVLLMLDLNGQTGDKAEIRASEMLASVGLDGMAKRAPDTLSGGEQQRVAIARALVHRPGLLLADEPTGNLDSSNAAQVAALLARLVAESGTTLVLATHSRSLAESCGQQIEMGRPATLS